jgi:hypothetical protein
MGFLLREGKPRRAFAGGIMTASLRPLEQCERLEDALETIDAMIRHRSCSPNDDGFLNYCIGRREGLSQGFKLGFTAGYTELTADCRRLGKGQPAVRVAHGSVPIRRGYNTRNTWLSRQDEVIRNGWR